MATEKLIKLISLCLSTQVAHKMRALSLQLAILLLAGCATSNKPLAVPEGDGIELKQLLSRIASGGMRSMDDATKNNLVLVNENGSPAARLTLSRNPGGQITSASIKASPDHCVSHQTVSDFMYAGDPRLHELGEVVWGVDFDGSIQEREDGCFNSLTIGTPESSNDANKTNAGFQTRQRLRELIENFPERLQAADIPSLQREYVLTQSAGDEFVREFSWARISRDGTVDRMEIQADPQACTPLEEAIQWLDTTFPVPNRAVRRYFKSKDGHDIKIYEDPSHRGCVGRIRIAAIVRKP